MESGSPLRGQTHTFIVDTNICGWNSLLNTKWRMVCFSLEALSVLPLQNVIQQHFMWCISRLRTAESSHSSASPSHSLILCSSKMTRLTQHQMLFAAFSVWRKPRGTKGGPTLPARRISGGCTCHIYPSHADHTEAAVNQASFYARVWLTYDYSLIWWLWETTLGKCDSSWVINAPVVNCWVVIYITDGWLLQQTWLRITKITAVDQGNNQHRLCLF